MKVEVGQVWREVDARFFRRVEIVGIDEGAGKAVIRPVGGGRKTRARLDRFNGRSGGYEWVSGRGHEN